MSLGFEMASAKTQLTVGGMGCLLSMSLGLVKLQVAPLILSNKFLFFQRQTHTVPVSYVALGTMSL